MICDITHSPEKVKGDKHPSASSFEESSALSDEEILLSVLRIKSETNGLELSSGIFSPDTMHIRGKIKSRMSLGI
jgi:hypothetical protein